MVDADVRALANTLYMMSPNNLSAMHNIVLKGSAEMKHVLAALTIGACLLLPSAGGRSAHQTCPKSHDRTAWL